MARVTGKKIAANVKDAASEAGHRFRADAERGKRDVGGNQMTAGQKVKSVAKEGSERTKAGLDKAKRGLRNRT